MSSQDTYFLCLVSVTDFAWLQLFKPCGQNISSPILHQGSLSCLITKKQRILALCLQPKAKTLGFPLPEKAGAVLPRV